MFELMFIIALIGLGAWCLIRFVPMPQAIKTVIIVVAVLGTILFAMRAFGIGFPSIGVPTVK